MSSTPYIIAGGREGASRLNVLADVLEPYTQALIRRVAGGLEGCRVLDLGCGGGNVSRLFARLTGDRGGVVGMDFDRSILELARAATDSEGLANVRFEAGSATELSYESAFDGVYSRFLLSHLQEPDTAVQRMVAAAKPGGWVVVEDVQFSGHFCYPAHTAFDEYLRLYAGTARNNGQDPEIGPSLLSRLRAAGLTDTGVDVVQPCFSSGPGKDMAWLTLDRISGAVVAAGLADQGTVAQTLDALRAFTADPQTLISLPRIFRAWGRKPR